MTKILASSLFAVLVAALTMHSIPPETVAHSAAVQPSFDIAMPALPALADSRSITALDRAGVSRTE